LDAADWLYTVITVQQTAFSHLLVDEITVDEMTRVGRLWRPQWRNRLCGH